MSRRKVNPMADRLLRPELEDRFLAIVDLFDASRAAGAGDLFEFTEVPGAAGLKLLVSREVHDRLGARPPHVDLSDLEELADRGLLAVSAESGPNGQRGRVRLTDAGCAYAQRARAKPPAAAPAGGGVGLDWNSDVRPVLEALYAVQSTLDATAYGVSQEQLNQHLGRSVDDSRTDRVLADLAQAGYLAEVLENDQRIGPIFCRLSEKALQEVAGWPRPGGSPVEAFLAALDDKLADPELSEEQRGWLLKMRDAAGNMSQSVISNLLAAYVKSQTGL